MTIRKVTVEVCLPEELIEPFLQHVRNFEADKAFVIRREGVGSAGKLAEAYRPETSPNRRGPPRVSEDMLGVRLIDVQLPDGSESWALPIGENEDTNGFGKWTGPKDDPTKWVYNGPLIGKTLKAEVVMKSLTSGATSPTVK